MLIPNEENPSPAIAGGEYGVPSRQLSHSIALLPAVPSFPVGIQAQYQSLFEDAPLGIALARASDLRFLQVNPAFCRLVDYSPEELLAYHSYRSVTFDDDQAREDELFSSVAAGQTDGYRMEKRYVRRDGSLVWAILTTSVVRNDDGTLRDVFGIVEDITARKEHEEEICRLNAALEQRVLERTAELEVTNATLTREVAERKNAEDVIRERERQLQAVTDNTTTVLARVDADGRYLFCNRALAERFCLTPDEIVGKTMRDVFPASAYAQMHPHIQVALSGKHVAYDAVLDYQNPGPRRVHVSYHPEFDANGAVVGFVVSASDLTDLHQAEEKATLTAQRLERVFESISDGFLVLDLDWRVAAMNGEAERLLARSRTALLGRNIWEAFPERVDGRFWRKCHEAVASQATVTFVTKFAELAIVIEIRIFPSSDGLFLYFRDVTQAHQDAQQLRLLDLAISSSNHGIVVMDTLQEDQPLVYVNPGFERMTGYPAHEALGRNCRFLQTPLTDTQDLDVLRTAIQSGIDAHVCLRNARKDGTLFWNDVRISPVFGENGRLTHFVGIQTDVTARRESEEQLRLLSSAIDNANDAVMISAAGGGAQPEPKIVYVNRAFTQMTGYSLEDLVGKTSAILQGPETDAATLEVLGTGMRSGEPVRAELRKYRKDGSPVWVELNIHPMTDGNGQCTHWISILRDVSQRKDEERERQKLSDHNRLLLESTEEGIYGVDRHGVCTFINPAAAAMLGYAPDELHGKNLHPIIQHRDADGRDYPQALSPVLKVFTAGESCSVDTEVFWRKDGTAMPVAYLSHPMKTAEGVVGAVVTFRDITERQAVEQERERLLAEAIDRADRDPLTGLLNHRAFQKRLAEEADRAQRTGEHLGVVVMDLNNFKFFNDAYGHLAGDEVLISISRALQGACRSYDTLARFGGDEFAMLLPGVDPAERQKIVDRLASSVAKISYLPDGYSVAIPLTISVGVAFFPAGVATRTDVLASADEDLRFAKTGGDQSGETALRLRHELLETTKGYEMLNALVTAVDNKDRYTRKHSEDVMHRCLQIAQELGWSEAQQRVLAIAALLHDVGKIGVPDKILRKPGSLNPDELDLMKQHPDMGAVIVAAVPGFEDTLDAVRHHHEHWNGSGYPHGLVGEDIPQIARIMAVADAFSAMTTNRPYRNGMPEDAAAAILLDGAGEQWDPFCVAAFMNARRRASSPAKA